MDGRPALIMLIDKIESGGAERVLFRLAEGLSEKYRITIISTSISEGSELISRQSLRIINFEFARGAWFGAKVLNVFRALLRVTAIYRKEKPVASISFLERSNVVNIIAGVLTSTPSVVSVRNNLLEQYKDRSWLERVFVTTGLNFLYRRAIHLVSLSKAVEQQLISAFGVPESRVSTIYNPFPFSEYQRLAQETVAHPSGDDDAWGNTILAVGRLSKQKGFIHLLRLFSRVLQSKPGAHLIILGDGELRAFLDQALVLLGLQGRVHFIANVVNPFPYYRQAGVFAFTSKWEGFGNALVEALSVANYVVTTDCEFGPREILEVKSGYERNECFSLERAFDNEDETAGAPLSFAEIRFADTLCHVMSNPVDTDTRCRDRLLMKFDEKEVIMQWRQLLNDVAR